MVGWPDQDPVTGDLNLSGGVTLSGRMPYGTCHMVFKDNRLTNQGSLTVTVFWWSEYVQMINWVFDANWCILDVFVGRFGLIWLEWCCDHRWLGTAPWWFIYKSSRWLELCKTVQTPHSPFLSLLQSATNITFQSCFSSFKEKRINICLELK